MNITYKEITIENIEDLQDIVRWDNLDDIKYFVRPNFKEDEIEDLVLQDLLDGFRSTKHTYMIKHDNQNIGYLSIDLDFPFLYDEKPLTAWISICIGEPTSRGKGIGRIAMAQIEDLCKTLGAQRIELGVFQYNVHAQVLYEKMGYKKIGSLKNFVYFHNQWYDDIRMEKILI